MPDNPYPEKENTVRSPGDIFRSVSAELLERGSSLLTRTPRLGGIPSSISVPIGTSRALGGLAILLALAVGLLLSVGNSVQAQQGPIMYAEDRTDPVATFTATDPEEKDITWSLATGGDAEDFDIDGGVLTFAEQPDYEDPADADTNNTYTVTVQAMAGTSTDAAISTATHDVTVMVTNVDEQGAVRLSTLQPQVEVVMTATLTDGDGGGTTDTPTWEWYRGSDIIAGAVSDTYTPMAGDVGSVLTARATYRDAEDTDNDKTAEVASAYAVRAAPATNIPPAFPDTDSDTAGNQQTRMVAENTPAGRNIGAPVSATDPGDVLTYSIDTTAESTFDIDRATGQLRTQAALNAEATASYTVTVTATDPFGATGTVTVTVTVTGVDEAPSIAAGAATTLTIDENETTLTLGTAYTATEPEGETVTWSVSGPDSGKFSIDAGQLSFRDSPDFEARANANRDNVYEVTVVAADPARNSDQLAVRVTVINVNEPGTITFSSVRPKVGVALTATLEDPDGGVTDLTWQWLNAGTAIEDATSSTYTPVVDDANDQLTVSATYRDASLVLGDDDITLTTLDAALGLVVADTDNKAPLFPDQDGDREGRQTDQERTVPENYATGDTYGGTGDADFTYPAIGAPVAAEVDNTLAPDGSPTADTLTYTLGGTDAASFDIVTASGQLQAKAALDYEIKSVYMVTVTATDPGGLSAIANVTIKVINDNESPEITGEAPAEYAENGTAPVATFRATDPEQATITWSLTGDDEGDFTLINGVLRFAISPDFEDAADSGGDNSYVVTVNASDGTNSATKDITITVTNVDETGKVTLSTLQPQVGVSITASLNDPDGDASSPTWAWFRGSTVIVGATALSYEPVQGDIGSILRARVTYTDPQSTTESKIAEGRSSRTVRRAPTDGNSEPAFPDQNPSTPEVETAQTREIPENTPPGRNIGAPVAATDSGDVLTYSIDATADATFDIDRATGQLKTQGALDTETTATYTVTVTATDPSEATGTSVVTITVTNVDEAPTIAAGAITAISSPEGTTEAPLTLTTALATYTATEPEGGTMSWSLSGADAGKFDIGNQTGGTPGELTFKAQPDFEARADANRDNVYEVTVVVADPDRNSDQLDVRVTVTNVAETGTITFSSLRPKVGVALTATLDDPDGGVTDLAWQWNDGTTDIEDATSATYTPVADNVGDTLSVTATYKDAESGTTDRSVTQAHSATVVADTDNKAPVFPDQDTAMEGPQTDQERTVAENTASDTPIQPGDLTSFTPTDNTLASDGTATADTLTYTLGGTDAASFSIDQGTGQISTKAALDYETKDTYMVTVTATDPGGLSATVNVTINVTDVDEAPEIMLGGLAISGSSSPRVPEGTTEVATYRAAGPNASMATWDLSGADEALFAISSAGELTFVSAPNFETPESADGDNVYELTVEADDGTYEASRDVRITVTDVDETSADDALVGRYDANNDGEIEKSEVITAINDYLDGGANAPTKPDVIRLINLYLDA